ncbi:unnamed protein product [Calypogeia fissa]
MRKKILSSLPDIVLEDCGIVEYCRSKTRSTGNGEVELVGLGSRSWDLLREGTADRLCGNLLSVLCHPRRTSRCSRLV